MARASNFPSNADSTSDIPASNAPHIARMHPDKRSVRRKFARVQRSDDVLLDMIRRIRRRE